MARVKLEQAVVASASNSAGGTTRGTIDVRERDGGILTVKFTNGSTGPTIACEARIMIAHTTGDTPEAGAAGSDWKTVVVFTGALGNNVIFERAYEFPPAVKHLQVEFTGNTGQAVTVEAIASTINYSG
jgi:hypothetical protein